MRLRGVLSLRSVVLGVGAVLALGAAGTLRVAAQDDDNPKPEVHGRKYKAPPETSHIEVTVVKGFNKKPIDGAHIIFHPVKDGVDEGNLEMKTHQDGRAMIDVIPTGSSLRIQVLADGFATFAENYVVNEATRTITIAMQRPKAQVSAYVDNDGKDSQMKPGVQEPIRPKKSAPAGGAATGTSAAATGSTPKP